MFYGLGWLLRMVTNESNSSGLILAEHVRLPNASSQIIAPGLATQWSAGLIGIIGYCAYYLYLDPIGGVSNPFTQMYRDSGRTQVLTGTGVVLTNRSIVLPNDNLPHIDCTSLATVPKRLVMARISTSVRNISLLWIMGRSIHRAWCI